jgi:hypothetical protein
MLSRKGEMLSDKSIELIEMPEARRSLIIPFRTVAPYSLPVGHGLWCA